MLTSVAFVSVNGEALRAASTDIGRTNEGCGCFDETVTGRKVHADGRLTLKCSFYGLWSKLMWELNLEIDEMLSVVYRTVHTVVPRQAHHHVRWSQQPDIINPHNTTRQI